MQVEILYAAADGRDGWIKRKRDMLPACPAGSRIRAHKAARISSSRAFASGMNLCKELIFSHPYSGQWAQFASPRSTAHSRGPHFRQCPHIRPVFERQPSQVIPLASIFGSLYSVRHLAAILSKAAMSPAWVAWYASHAAQSNPHTAII
jgi:hypothetical protein